MVFAAMKGFSNARSKSLLYFPLFFVTQQIMIISTIMTTVAFFLPLAVGECRAVPTDLEGWSPAGIASVERLVTLNCHHGEYNEV